MKEIDLYDPSVKDMADLSRMAQLLFGAVQAAIDSDNPETTRVMIDGRPMATIAPYIENGIRIVDPGDTKFTHNQIN